MKLSWHGVYPAVTTKFHETGELDEAGFKKGIQAQIDAGVHGIIVGGSLGESSTLSHDDRLILLEYARDVAGDIPVLMNVAEGSTESALSLISRADDIADGIMLLPPMMYRPTKEETVAYFAAIARGTDLPILIYHNPVDYNVEITTAMFESLLREDNIEAVKESTRDVSNVTRLRSAFGDRLKILCGVDTLAMESFLMGADGWVAGLVNAFPKETVAIYDLINLGQVEAAREIYRWFLPILELDISPQLVQNIKLAESVTGLGTEHVRPPRKPLSGEERERVLAILNKGLSTRPKLDT